MKIVKTNTLHLVGVFSASVDLKRSTLVSELHPSRDRSLSYTAFLFSVSEGEDTLPVLDGNDSLWAE